MPKQDFGEWLEQQVHRDDPIGDLAEDYTDAIRNSLHERVSDPEQLRWVIVSRGAVIGEALEQAAEEWKAGY